MWKVPWGRKKNIEPVKEIFKILYEEFPFLILREDQAKTVFVKEEDIKSLVKHGFLIENQSDNWRWYSLGPNGLLLGSTWEMENHSRKMAYLTYAILILALASIIMEALRWLMS